MMIQIMNLLGRGGTVAKLSIDKNTATETLYLDIYLCLRRCGELL